MPNNKLIKEGKGTMEDMVRIDKALEPEVNDYIKACNLSYEKYGNILHTEEFLTPHNK